MDLKLVDDRYINLVSSGNMYLEDSEKGESCTGSVSVDSDVIKIIFFEGSVSDKK